jgi:hypothetical protein
MSSFNYLQLTRKMELAMSIDGKVSNSAAIATAVTHDFSPSLAQNLELQTEYGNELSR